MTPDEIRAYITQLRAQMLVHSHLYYEMGESVLTDSEFDARARKLAELQREYPDIARECKWHEYFADWDGTTGYKLPLDMPWIRACAIGLLAWANDKKTKEAI